MLQWKLINISSKITYHWVKVIKFTSTVKPVYNGHPWDLKKAAVV